MPRPKSETTIVNCKLTKEDIAAVARVSKEQSIVPTVDSVVMHFFRRGVSEQTKQAAPAVEQIIPAEMPAPEETQQQATDEPARKRR